MICYDIIYIYIYVVVEGRARAYAHVREAKRKMKRFKARLHNRTIKYTRKQIKFNSGQINRQCGGITCILPASIFIRIWKFW